MKSQPGSSIVILCRRIGRLAMVGLLGMLPQTAGAQSWNGYGRSPQHNATAPGPSQLPQLIRWSTPVDLAPQYSSGQSGALYTHYGSPVITGRNTLIVPVKTGANGPFEVTAFHSATGQVLWTETTDYTLPPNYNWIPPMGITLTGADLAVAYPGAGGIVYLRSSPDKPSGRITPLAFMGLKNYNKDPLSYQGAIHISTPLSADGDGNIYFGYISSFAGIPSGLARVSRRGATYIAASAMCNDAGIEKVVMNCAPALSWDGTSVYVAVNRSNFSDGYLCQVANGPTFTPMNAVHLKDPATGNPASLPDDGTASPTIGPDNDVYFGVLESNFPGHHARGWLLHFNSTLTTLKTPGSFGWDDSASVVPSRLVPSYRGGSPYLILTKYNDYSDQGINGSGQNKVALLDPNATEPDPIENSVQSMKEVLTVVGPTRNTGQAGVREWCINTAAIDEANRCAVVNSEDGHVYRWSFVTNTLSPGLQLAPPTGEAYTPTVIGPDGAVYAINNARLFCCISTGLGGTAGTGAPVLPGDGTGTELARSARWVFPGPSLMMAVMTASLFVLAGLGLALALRRTAGRAVPLIVRVVDRR